MMPIAEFVKRLMDAGANSEVVAIVLEYLEDVAEAAKPKRRRKKPELVRAVK
jgi:hypothetical protein